MRTTWSPLPALRLGHASTPGLARGVHKRVQEQVQVQEEVQVQALGVTRGFRCPKRIQVEIGRGPMMRSGRSESSGARRKLDRTEATEQPVRRAAQRADTSSSEPPGGRLLSSQGAAV